ncbi:MAG: TIGR01777 family oxidoreductase [Acidimicrobiales bacterium]
MKIAVTGTHGLIAGHLIPELEAAGHQIVAIVRSAPRPGQVRWDPAAGTLDPDALSGVQAVVHLAGVGLLARRWNDAHKRDILDSRLEGTKLIARRVAELSPAPAVLVSGSAIGFYGDRGDEELTEASVGGSGFLAEVCRQWEAATAPASEAGIRTVTVRTGIVQSPDGGALKPQVVPFKLGLGARLGRGRHWTSWVSIADEVGAIRHALEHDGLEGPVNLTAPNPVTNADYTRTLARVLGRPAFLAVPAPALELALGREMAQEMLLASQRVLPRALETSGYRFRDPELEPALRRLLGR